MSLLFAGFDRNNAKLKMVDNEVQWFQKNAEQTQKYFENQNVWELFFHENIAWWKVFVTF